jgi:hypothetical protein
MNISVAPSGSVTVENPRCAGERRPGHGEQLTAVLFAIGAASSRVAKPPELTGGMNIAPPSSASFHGDLPGADDGCNRRNKQLPLAENRCPAGDHATAGRRGDQPRVRERCGC